MAYSSQDVDKWLQGIMSDQGITSINDANDMNSLTNRYGLNSQNANYDLLSNNLIDKANAMGGNLSKSRYMVGGLSDALRNVTRLANIDAARGRITPDTLGNYDTGLFSANGKGRLADWLSTGSLFNRGETGTGNVSALGYQELPGAYREIVSDIGNRYMGNAKVGDYADNSATQAGLQTLINSMYGNSVAGMLAGNQLTNDYLTQTSTTGPFQKYWQDVIGGQWDTSSRSFTPTDTRDHSNDVDPDQQTNFSPVIPTDTSHQDTAPVPVVGTIQNPIGDNAATPSDIDAVRMLLGRDPTPEEVAAYMFDPKGFAHSVSGKLGSKAGHYGGITVTPVVGF